MKRYRGKHRVSKADLKEDGFQRAVEKVAEVYYRDRQRFWIVGGVVVAIIVGGVLLLQNRGGGPNDEAQIRFTEALGVFSQGNMQQAEQAFSNVASRFGRQPVGVQAHYYLGQVYYSSQRFQEAANEYRKFLKGQGRNPVLGPAAQMGLGDAEVALGSFLKAGEEYEAVHQKYEDSPLAYEAMMAAGRAYVVAGAYDRAEAVYEQLLEEEPTGEKAEDLKVQLSYVKVLRSKY